MEVNEQFWENAVFSTGFHWLSWRTQRHLLGLLSCSASTRLQYFTHPCNILNSLLLNLFSNGLSVILTHVIGSYSESLYALFSIGGVYHWFSGAQSIAVLWLAVSGLARSNGMLNAGYICFHTLLRAYEALIHKKRTSVSFLNLKTSRYIYYRGVQGKLWNWNDWIGKKVGSKEYGVGFEFKILKIASIW